MKSDKAARLTRQERIDARQARKAAFVEITLDEDWVCLRETIGKGNDEERQGLPAARLDDWETVRDIVDKRIALLRAQDT